MNKEYLEAFKNLKQELYYSPNQIPDIDKWHETIEKALKRLEAIDNADFSEALKCLEKLGRLDLYESYINLKVNEVNEFGIIKQALIKAQELEEDNSVLVGENNDLYTELTFAAKQYKELIECAKNYRKILKIVKEKGVDVSVIMATKTVEEYNDFIQYYNSDLNEAEYNLLRECFKNER